MNPFISLAEATELLNNHTSEVLIVEIVSDYHTHPAAQQYSPPLQANYVVIRTEQIEIDQEWKLRPDPELQQVLSENGIQPDKSKILLFDNIRSASSAHNTTSTSDASARLFTVLHYFGFTNVAIVLDQAFKPHLLNLPLPHSKRTGLTETFSTVSSMEATNSRLGRRNIFVNYDQLTQTINSEYRDRGNYRLLEARNAEEFEGKTTGYDYVKTAGRIPTSEHLSSEDYEISKHPDIPSLLAQLQVTLSGIGIARDDKIIWYCGTAWRASRMFALTIALGYSNVAIYDGGWHEWQQRQATT